MGSIPMDKQLVALFGESEKGDFGHPYLCESLPQLVDYLGQPPAMSQGLHFAVQALMYHQALLFFRVREEGFSTQDYYYGLRLLKDQEKVPDLGALCMPGVGDVEIIQASSIVCVLHHTLNHERKRSVRLPHSGVVTVHRNEIRPRKTVAYSRTRTPGTAWKRSISLTRRP